MQIEHLRCFQAVADYGSMSKAAKALFCTQPTITNAIRNLEADLGYPLLLRTDHGIELTDFGRSVLEDTHLILGYLDRWKRLAQNSSSGQTITIGLSGSSPKYMLIDAILQIRAQAPALDINMTCLPTIADNAGRYPFVSDTHCRIIITYRVPAHLSDAKRYCAMHGMRLAILQKDEFRLFFNANHSLASLSEDITLEDLRNRRVILFQNPNGFPYIQKLLSVHCGIGPQVWSEENLMIALALDDNMISFRPSGTADRNPYVLDGTVRTASVVDCPMPVNLCIFYPVAGRIAESERFFIEYLKKYFPDFEAIG